MRGFSCLLVLTTLLVIAAALPQSSSGSRPNAGRRNWWSFRRTQWPDVPDRAFLPVADTNPTFAAAQAQAQAQAQQRLAVALQNARDASTWSQAESSRMGGPGSAFRPVTKRPEDAAPSRPFFPATAPSFGAGSSQEAESSYARADIPNQNAAQDRIYGLGHSKFVARAYPVDTPLFTHLYSDESLVPVNFEDYVQGIRLLSLGSAYRPEPALLRAMQSMIWTKLGRFGFNPMQVAGTPDLVEGQYLWPPLSRDRYTGNVNMPADVLRRLRGTVKDRLRRLRPSDPDLYHLQVNGRHILAFTTKPIYQVNLPFTPSRSDLWMFFEMMAPRDANAAVPHLTLLGSTFLPRGARRLMTSGDVMWPAFLNAPRR
ncbi:hypothetical protein PANT_6d00022 [Moesziomyces antarcticus T-34]|uniref:Uncharacterized protein n=1 Tax=Pseudozyma antarctica (strain T-34) TaxID=1151754 RepID=M9LTJ1_PSEA3|nr:hypothetical protein PANT_6d00022 [Moesziomyces antarcticus T-34]